MTTNRKEEAHHHGDMPGEERVQVGVLQNVRVGKRQKAKRDRVHHMVDRCRAGDRAAFHELFKEHVAGVHRHLSMLIGPGADVDDLVQLVFLNVYNSIGRFKGQSAFSTWLFRITVNVARQEIREKNRHRRIHQAAKDVGCIKTFAMDGTPESHLNLQQQIYGILDRLSARKRESFILFTYEGYSLEEIAELLGSSVSTIGSRLQSARKEIIRILAHRRIK